MGFTGFSEGAPSEKVVSRSCPERPLEEYAPLGVRNREKTSDFGALRSDVPKRRLWFLKQELFG